MNKFITLLTTLISTMLFTVATLASSVEKHTILVVGDSLSAAYNMPQDAGWVSLLEKRLSENNFSATTVNASIGGDTTAGGLSRINEALRYAKPSLTIIELGGNDGLRGLPIDEMRNNLEQMIVTAKTSGSEVMLLGVQLPPNYGPTYTKAFSDSFSLLADKYDVALVPSMLLGFEDDPNYFQADQIHPSADAQVLILNNVWPTIYQLLK